ECTVVIYACSTPQRSLMTLIIGAALLVVQDALDMIFSVPSRIWSFTPSTTIFILSSAGGTDRITFLAPFFRCCSSSELVLNFPVDSITTSTSNLFQSSCSMFDTWVSG